jgi:hypothetical protein
MSEDGSDSVAAAMAVLDRFMAGLNAEDEAAVNAAFNFPHVRIASGRVAVWEKEGDYRLADFRARAGDGWAASAWDERAVLHAGPDKVHLAVRFTRRRADGSPLGTFRSLWIVTRVDGRWGVQARSSFAA